MADRREIQNLFDHAIEDIAAGLGVGDLAAAELYEQADLVTLVEETTRVLDLEVEVVLVGLGSELDLFELLRLLVALGLALALGGLVLELAVVHDLADWRHGLGIDLYQLQTLFVGPRDRVVGGEDTELRAVGVDYSYVATTDASADSVSLFPARRGLRSFASDGGVLLKEPISGPPNRREAGGRAGCTLARSSTFVKRRAASNGPANVSARTTARTKSREGEQSPALPLVRAERL